MSNKFDEWLEPVLTEKERQQKEALQKQSQKVQKDLDYCTKSLSKRRLLDNHIKKLTVKPRNIENSKPE